MKLRLVQAILPIPNNGPLSKSVRKNDKLE